jgi:hypothetical protein
MDGTSVLSWIVFIVFVALVVCRNRDCCGCKGRTGNRVRKLIIRLLGSAVQEVGSARPQMCGSRCVANAKSEPMSSTITSPKRKDKSHV